MFQIPLVDMAKTPEEVKEDTAQMPAPGTAVNGSTPKTPVYPYGLCVSLDDDSLEKLGLDGALPPVGAMLIFCAEARVTSASMREDEDTTGKKSTCRRVELQICRMGCPPGDAAEAAVASSAQRQAKWYGHAEPDGDEV